ncbi:Tom37 C-terminal domain-containing protein [Aspergillus bertholletiae]|uniref:Tom37 C-terminal domain-containing protein n=1 Tax=Aspergillus bertholletiae TaxID=1226010 RepID=A0A5N7AUK4_9EURO|nr:Tom37 C-terminal domain-containing protein [Aspergillus bertholletiae]
MVLELHVWGPAFSLPSIEAQCLATIAYFSLAVPKDAWVLVASSDPSVSPTCELPALRNGSTWVSRFRNIVDYLRQYSNGEWDLDGGLSGLQKADKIGFSSFVESRAHALVDLSLYVTSQNYYNQTSPAYGSILQWPSQWILPPKIHAAAKARTDHLGLSSLDLQAIEEQRQREHSAAVAAGQIPPNFISRPRDTVTSLLGKTSQQNQFRLDALTGELFEPLEEILGDKVYLLTGENEGPSSLDCLAVGYLSLALVPELSFSWLRDAMKSKASRLTVYTERMRQQCFGLNAEVSHAYTPTPNSGSSLPWRAPERARLTTLGNTLFSALADNTPILKDIRAQDRLRVAAESPDSGLSGPDSQKLSAFAKGQKKDLLVNIAYAVGGIAALVGYMAYEGFFSVEVSDEYEEEDELEDDEFEPMPDIEPGSLQVESILAGL